MGQVLSGSTGKLLLLFVGALLVLIVVFQLAESVVPKANRPAAAAAPAEAPPPIRPTVERIDENTIVVDAGFFHKSRFGFGAEDSKEQVDALHVCLEAGIEREFGPVGGTAAGGKVVTDRRELRKLMTGIQEACMESVMRLPGPGRLPQIPTPPSEP